MIYPNDNPLAGGHVADNRLASANIETHYELIDGKYIPVIDTPYNTSKRDNYVNNTDLTNI